MKRLLLSIPLLFSCAAWGQTFNINPFLSCVTVDPNTQVVTAYWGYESFEPNTVQVRIGADNQIIPPQSTVGQVELFFPGLHEKAFRTPLAQGLAEWLMLGILVPATAASPRCPSTAQIASGQVGTPYSQQLSAFTGQAGATWTVATRFPAGAFPAGLSLSPSGLISGTPTQAGTSNFTVNVSDGVTADSRTFSITINPAASVAINDPVSTRPPGFTPQYRVATAVSSGITGNANCDATEFLITGGGTCTVPNVNTVQGRVASSGPNSTNGWQVTCSGGTATAVAVCNKK